MQGIYSSIIFNGNCDSIEQCSKSYLKINLILCHHSFSIAMSYFTSCHLYSELPVK